MKNKHPRLIYLALAIAFIPLADLCYRHRPYFEESINYDYSFPDICVTDIYHIDKEDYDYCDCETKIYVPVEEWFMENETITTIDFGNRITYKSVIPCYNKKLKFK